MTELTVEEICDRFSKIYTGAISDILDEMGYRNQVLPSTIKGLTHETTVVGRALPVLGEVTTSVDPEVIFVPLLKMLGDVKPYDVIVSQAQDTIAAHLGELSATTAKVRGGVGAIINGGARDIDYILKLEFPVFCCYTTPTDVLGRWRLVDYNIPVQIGTIIIHPGDYIVGDKDGVIVIPKEIAMQVLLNSEDVVNTEDLVRKSIVKGIHPVDAFLKYGRF